MQVLKRHVEHYTGHSKSSVLRDLQTKLTRPIGIIK